MLVHENTATINGKIYAIRYLNRTESEFIGCVNEGYLMGDVITIGYCDNPIWETVILWHEIGHVVLDTENEAEVWDWVLRNSPVSIPLNMHTTIQNRRVKWYSQNR